MANEKYPRWRERWNERVNDIDNEIESWWQRNKASSRDAETVGQAAEGAWDSTKVAADRIGDRIAGNNDPDTLRERAGDTAGNWWASVKNTVADWFDGDDDEARAEYRQAWDDPEYITERFEERRQELKNNGKLV
ncbi:MAG: hypothetical protein M3R04_07470 [bacterium]|nr:hypothetical protein [bacterium]